MKNKKRVLKQLVCSHPPAAVHLWSKLQMRMTFSYIGVTVVSVLLLELVVGGTILMYVAQSSAFSRISGASLPLGLVRGWIASGLFWVIIMAPVGGFFGAVSTHQVVQRIHRLVIATMQFSSGDYNHRVPITKRDEIGQLEQQFNSMAEQLVESIAQRQLLIEQQVRMEERARTEQELQTARYIQQALLPKTVPALTNWNFTPIYRPAREVGGDFYDFLPLANGHLGLVIGDATGKGVPAALVMTTTCTMIRAAAQGQMSPAAVLARVNTLLSASIPSGMFVTCFYAVLDPESGRLRYANAGQDWPYLLRTQGLIELQATGMPLGMLSGTSYEEHEVTVASGESILFYSDGLIEARNQCGEMFGQGQLTTMLKASLHETVLVDTLLSELMAFTGPDREQEDDVTMILMQRTPVPAWNEERENWRPVMVQEIASIPGNERLAMSWIAEVVSRFHLSDGRSSNLATAVAEAVMNAMEHGNHYLPDMFVSLQVSVSQAAIAVSVTDKGIQQPGNEVAHRVEPDLDAKLLGLQSPRGWGVFLMKHLVDELRITEDKGCHTIKLIMKRELEEAAPFSKNTNNFEGLTCIQ